MHLKLNPEQVKGISPVNYHVIAWYRSGNNLMTLLVDHDMADTIVLAIDKNLATVYGNMDKRWRKALVESKGGTFSIDGLKFGIPGEEELAQLLSSQWDVEYRSVHCIDER